MCLQRSRRKFRFRTLHRKSEWCYCLSLPPSLKESLIKEKKWNLFIQMYTHIHTLHTYTCSVHAFKLLRISVSEDVVFSVPSPLSPFFSPAFSPPSPLSLTWAHRLILLCVGWVLMDHSLESIPVEVTEVALMQPGWVSLTCCPCRIELRGLVFSPPRPPTQSP